MSIGYNDSVIMKYDNKQYAVALNILTDQICTGCSPFSLTLSCAKIAQFFKLPWECDGLTRECLSEGKSTCVSPPPVTSVFPSRSPDHVFSALSPHSFSWIPSHL